MLKDKWEQIVYRFWYRVCGIELRWGMFCGRVGEWFLWQEWKQCTDREEFERDIRRLRGITEKEYHAKG